MNACLVRSAVKQSVSGHNGISWRSCSFDNNWKLEWAGYLFR
jgi:hypothetical protein